MNRLLLIEVAACLWVSLLVAGCDTRVKAKETETGTGPVPAQIESDFDANHFSVDHPEQFPLATAVEQAAAPELNVTGVVNPDVSRQVPVPSLATGRIVEVNARLGDSVQKGQLLFKVRSNEIAAAYADYRKAVKNEELAKTQLNRARILFDDGAIPKSAMEVAQTNEDNALVDVETTTEHLRLLGADPEHPAGVVEVYAPISGVITDQQITNQSGIQALTPSNPFTISDMSRVWIICDVFEDNLAQVRIGQFANIHLVAYPSRVLRGRISNILPAIDPAIRTAKVRLEVENPEGILRLGMFVTAALHGTTVEKHASVPATAILHLHDREWVYMRAGERAFRRVEVTAGRLLPNNQQEIVSGIRPGDHVVANALVLQNTAEQ